MEPGHELKSGWEFRLPYVYRPIYVIKPDDPDSLAVCVFALLRPNRSSLSPYNSSTQRYIGGS